MSIPPASDLTDKTMSFYVLRYVYGLRMSWFCPRYLISVFLHLHEIVEGLYFHCSLSVCLCVCVCVCVCPDFLWTKFQPNGCTDLDAIFAKWLLNALAQTLLKLVTLGQRSRSRWPKMYVNMMKKIRQKFISRHFWNQISSFDWKFYRRHFDTKYDHIAR